MTREVLSGNHAQSVAAARARVEVVSAYPITPQTSIVEMLSELVASGALKARFVPAESEHSALQIVVSASALGARTYTATSSHGLLLMHELLHWAAGLRVPVVMGVVNRAIGPPWSIGADHADTMSQRDTGWIQFYPESNQEVLDTVLTAFRFSEDPEVRLPTMVGEDAFFLSHTSEPVDVPTVEEADRFLPPRVPLHTLVPGVPARLGSFAGPESYVLFRRAVARAMEGAPKRILAAEEEYERVTGRSLGGLLPLYRTDDADAVLVTMGTATTTARAVVDELRSAGAKVGLVKLRCFRPFPHDELVKLAGHVGRVGVLDRSFTFGHLGPAATEVASALFESGHHPAFATFVAGVGGRDITPNEVRAMFDHLLKGRTGGPSWVDLGELAGVSVDG